ncbi:MAG: ABC transporter permease [Mariprofundaceae bacterium]
MRLFQALGAVIESFLARFGLYSSVLGQVLRRMATSPRYPRLIITQAEMIGVQSLPVVLLTALFTGMVLALQSYIALHRFGAESMVGTIVSMSMLRELGPVLVGLMVAGRVGASFAAELGTMCVTEQIAALWTLSTDPFRYLIMPRIIAAVLMMPLLVALADGMGVWGGYLISTYLLEQNPAVYADQAVLYLELEDFYSGLFKAAVFGLIIAVVSCSEGFFCKGGAQGVGRGTTRAVVVSCMSILISDFFMTAWLFQ